MGRQDVIVFRRLTTPSAMGWLAVTLLGLLGVLTYAWVAQPGARWVVLVVAAVLLVGTLSLLIGRDESIDPAAGTVIWRRLVVRRVTWALSDVEVVVLVAAGPAVHLGLRTSGRHRRFLPVLLMSDYVRACQPPEVLRAVADAIEEHVSAPGSAAVVADLRAQAKHLRTGGSVADSPLAGKVRNGLIRTAGALGAAGGGGSLLS